MHTKQLLKNIYLIIEAMKKFKNWPDYFLDLFKLTKKNEIIYETRDGLKLLTRAKTTDRGILTTLILQDEYELEKLSLTNFVVIDIGGQNGYFSCLAAKKGGTIYTFEPILDNYAYINKNIALNNMENNIHPFNLAVSNLPNKVKIFRHKENTGGHSIYGTGNNFIEVQAIRLANIFDEHKIEKCDLLKMDVEGSEYNILYNLEEIYFKKIMRISMECHNIDKEKNNPQQLIEFLKGKKFDVVYKEPILFANRQHI